MENYIFLVKFIMYFIIYSFLGWVMESIIKTIVQRKFVNSGFLYGPFCPIYGFGAIIMFLFLQRFERNIFILFIMAFLVLSFWEYIVGCMLEKMFQTKYWDYSENKFNIKGRVCLLNSLFWGVLGVVFIKYMHPVIIEQIDKIPANHLIFFTLLLFITIIVDLIVSIIKIKNININLEKLKEITNTIKERIEELETKQRNRDNLQQIIEELKYKQEKIRTKLLKQTTRLKKAFPTIKSDAIERFNEFIKEKKENIKNKK